MPNLFKTLLAVAAICAVPAATIAIAADHRDGSLIANGTTVDNPNDKKAEEQTPEHSAINTWRKTRVLIRRPPIVRPPVDQ